MGISISVLGSGWLGLAAALKLSDNFTSVNISTRSVTKARELKKPDLKAFVVDIDSISDNIQLFLQSEILLITITSKNIEAFKHLIKEIEQSPVKKVIFISSTSVYPEKNSICREDDDLEDIVHPLVKIERLLQENKNFQTTILRCAGLIGGQRHPGRFFNSKQIQNILAPVNLVHRDDCLQIISLIIAKAVWGKVLNVCADTHPAKADFYTYNAAALGLDKPDLGTQNSGLNKVVSNEVLKSLLDYRFIHADLMQIDPIADYDLSV
ncbi:NAD(P)H-binding protein [Psychromonas aquimarina]|uniref:NAD(P)H-binding protein n=1 Tax=Psychromonas aquimarina TaxID=444919 RepID=UPI0004188F5B|nr:NAD(P)H-binding protein [Psychromonas aquimarina]